LKITITKPFTVVQAGRVIIPDSCEAFDVNHIVTIKCSHGSFEITSGRFRELVNDETIKIDET
jgi:hypothetical protein